jgi:hypothetical protein
MHAELAAFIYPKRRAVESVVELRPPEVQVPSSGEELRERLEAALRSRMGDDYMSARSREVAAEPFAAATSTLSRTV